MVSSVDVCSSFVNTAGLDCQTQSWTLALNTSHEAASLAAASVSSYM
jgi:hypothetical protein